LEIDSFRAITINVSRAVEVSQRPHLIMEVYIKNVKITKKCVDLRN
jgi:hypothetical protein